MVIKGELDVEDFYDISSTETRVVLIDRFSLLFLVLLVFFLLLFVLLFLFNFSFCLRNLLFLTLHLLSHFQAIGKDF